jgi:hypothetical protein
LGQCTEDMRNNGRLAMSAALGLVARSSSPAKLASNSLALALFASVAIVTSALGAYGFIALFVLSGVMELALWQQDAKKEAGNFGDPVGFGRTPKTCETSDGRLVMFAALGIGAAYLLTGEDGTAPGAYGFIALFVLSGVMELALWQQDAKKEAGNFGDPVGFGRTPKTCATRNLAMGA